MEILMVTGITVSILIITGIIKYIVSVNRDRLLDRKLEHDYYRMRCHAELKIGSGVIREDMYELDEFVDMNFFMTHIIPHYMLRIIMRDTYGQEYEKELYL